METGSREIEASVSNIKISRTDRESNQCYGPNRLTEADVPWRLPPACCIVRLVGRPDRIFGVPA